MKKQQETAIKKAGKAIGFLQMISIPNLLPVEGKLEDVIASRDIKKKLAISQKMLNDFQFKSLKNGNVSMNAKGHSHISHIVFTPREEALIKAGVIKRFNLLKKEEKITEYFLSICELFNVSIK